ncbi:MAG: thioredoxin family protein [Chloroflexi bacterium]|nr:MAG: thioredoxin family protein [Chloroflexota bacterium]
MKVEILGTGCYNCLQLELLVGEVLQELGREDVTVVKVNDERQIRHHIPVEAAPGLVINGRLVSQREVPNREVLTRWLSEALADEG